MTVLCTFTFVDVPNTICIRAAPCNRHSCSRASSTSLLASVVMTGEQRMRISFRSHFARDKTMFDQTVRAANKRQSCVVSYAVGCTAESRIRNYRLDTYCRKSCRESRGIEPIASVKFDEFCEYVGKWGCPKQSFAVSSSFEFGLEDWRERVTQLCPKH